MSFTATFWSFAKEVNSTKQPPALSGTQYTCVANSGTNIINPTITIQAGLGGASSPISYNYCQIGDFGNRYYFVENWEWGGGLWTAYLQVDVLATYRTGIGNLSEYVVRSAHSYDGTISDGLYPAKNDYVYGYVACTEGQIWLDTYYSGLFVVGVIGGSGATVFYGMSLGEMASFFDYLMSDNYVDSVLTEWQLNTYPEAKAIVDPLQYITKVTYFPFTVDMTGFTSQNIDVGFGEVPNITCAVVGGANLASVVKITVSFSNFNFHDLAATRGVYLNYAPWTRRYVWIPPFGIIEIDCTQLSTTCDCDILIDLITGYGRLQVFGIHMLTELKTKVGIDQQLSQVISKEMGTLSILQHGGNLVSQIMGGITGGGGTGASISNIAGAEESRLGMEIGAVVGGAASAVSGISGWIKDAIESKIPTAHTIGSTGGFMDVTGTPFMFWIFTMPVDESRDTRGRPLCQKVTLNTLKADANNSGYLLVADPDITGIAATAVEREAIKSFLANGFFYTEL